MSQSSPPLAQVLVFSAAALVLTVSFGVGRLVAEQDTKGDASAPKVLPKSVPSAPEERYKVPISISQPTRGAADALVNVVEWCDLQGDACRQSDAIVQSLLREYEGRMRHVFRHFPAEASPESMLAHEFARIAHEQGSKFWEARAALLANDDAVTMPRLKSIATRIGMDFSVFSKALKERNHAGYVGADGLFAGKFGVAQAPTFFVNGRKLRGEASRATLKQLIDDELAYAGKLAAQGVPLENLYTTITEHGLWEAASAQLGSTP
jgi:protein-disulfide isomerase